jgi:hypothetical protein
MADRDLIRMQTIDPILGASSIIGNMAIIAATFQMRFSAECSTDPELLYHTKVTLCKGTWAWQFEFDSSESRVRVCDSSDESSKDAYLTGSSDGWIKLKNILLVNDRGDYNLQFIVGLLLFFKGAKEVLLTWDDDYNVLSKDSSTMLMSRHDAENYCEKLEDSLICVLWGNRKDRLQENLGSIAFVTLLQSRQPLELDAVSSVK